MRLYEIQYVDADDVTHREWHGTQADYKRRLKELKKDFVPKMFETDVPVNKEGLMAFLNKNCTIVPEDE